MKLYRLATHNGYETRPFGPLMTLRDAMRYRGLMAESGKACLVVNVTSE